MKNKFYGWHCPVALCAMFLAASGCGERDAVKDGHERIEDDANTGGQSGGNNNQNDRGCGDIPDSGRCGGTVVRYCENGELRSYDCAQERKTCGTLSQDGRTWDGCVATTVTPENPGPTGPVTAEDWARARISGTVSTEDAFNAIAYNGGFPVITDDNTVIFMHWYEGGDWRVAGDFNGWTGSAMTRDGDVVYLETPLPENVVEKNFYKFVSQDGVYSADPWSLRYTYTEDGEISYISKPAGAHLMRYPNFKSPQGLGARTLRVYVPAGEGPFDVIYAHDGQNLFGGGWKVEENMAKAEASFIVVGIDSIGDVRLSEYAFSEEDLTSVGMGHVSPRGDDYAGFVHESVRPFIESHYSVTAKAGLMGSSMGGLVSLYIAHLYPESYKAVLALSPTTAWGRFNRDDGRTMEEMYVEAGHRNYILYLDNGGNAPQGGTCPEKLGTVEASGDESYRDCYCFTRSFVDKMAEIGYRWDVDLFHHFEPGAAHDENAWAARLVKPLSIFRDAK